MTSVTEWTIPATGVRPPFLILAAVLAIAPVAGHVCVYIQTRKLRNAKLLIFSLDKSFFWIYTLTIKIF